MNVLAMGQYGAYVWSSFTLALIVLIVCVVQARVRHNKTISDIKTRLHAMEPKE